MAPSIASLLVLGGTSGLLGSLLGLGGGMFLVPLLTIFTSLPLQAAVATSLVAVIATATSSTTTYLKSGQTNVRLAIVLEIATTFGAVLGGLLVAHLSESFLAGLFAMVALYTAWSMLPRHRAKTAGKDRAGAGSPAVKGFHIDGTYLNERGKETPYEVSRFPLGLGASVFAGMISALLGVGGGAVKVPIMHLLMKAPLKVSLATSNFMVGITAATSAFFYYKSGFVYADVVAPVALSVLIGAKWGALVQRKLNTDILKVLFAVILVYLAANLVRVTL